MAGAAGTVPKLNQLPLPPEQDGEPGIVEKAGVLGRAARSGAKWALEGGPSGRSAFSYSILKDGEHIGEVHGTVDGAVANVHWMGSNEKITSDALNTMHEAFKKDFPDVEVFKGDRISGARGQARDELMRRAKQARLEGDEKEALALSTKAEDISMQHVKLREAGGGLAAALMASGQMHMQDDDVEEVSLLGKAGKTAAAAASKNLLKWGDTPVWAVVIDEKSGRVIHGVPYEKAKEADFHHSHYLPERMTERINAGKARIVWGDGRGLQSMEPMPDDLKEVVAGQVGKGTAAVAGAAGAAATGSDDAEAGIIGKAAGKFAISANESKLKDRFLYTMQRDGQPIGVLKGIITPSGKAHVFWIGDATEAEGKKISLKYGEIRDLMKRLKEDFPQATHWQGDRLSGAHEGGLQQTKLREGASGFMAALGAAGAVFGDEPPPKDGGTTLGDVARVPLDLLSYNATGMPAGEALQTGKDLVMAGREALGGGQTKQPPAGVQSADALTPDSQPPPELEPLDPPGMEEVGASQPPGGFWDAVKNRWNGTDVEDPFQWQRMGPGIMGGVLGGKLGGAAMAPTGPVGVAAGTAVGGIAGAVGAMMFPEATMEIGTSLGLLPENYREEHGLSNADLKTLAKGEAAIDLATGGGLLAARTAFRGLSKGLTGTGKAGRQLAEDAAREGIALMPVMVGDRWIARGFVNVMGRFPIVSTPIKRWGVPAAKRLQEAYTRLPERIAPIASMSDTHMKVMTEVEGLATKINDEFVPRFNEILTRRGVSVAPTETAGSIQDMVDEVGALIPSAGPVTAGKQGAVRMPRGNRVTELQTFLNKTLLPVAREGNAADQTLQQMDSLLGAVETEIAKFAKKGDIQAVGILEKVRTGIQTDMIGNLRGPKAAETAADLRRVTAEWSGATEELFTNAVAKRLGVGPAEGFRAVRFSGARDQVADTIGMVMRSSDPSMVKDLSRVLSPQGFKDMTSAVLADRIRDATIRNTATGTAQFDPGKFAKAMGLDAPGSGKFLQTEELLKHSGGLSMKDLQRLDDIAVTVDKLDIPDVSTFIARRGTIAGLKGVVNSLVPAMAVGGAGGAATRGSMTSKAIGAMTVMLGARGFARSISRPANARLWRRVVDEDISSAVRMAAYDRLIRLTVGAGKDALEMGPDVAAATMEAWETLKAGINKEAARQKSAD